VGEKRQYCVCVCSVQSYKKSKQVRVFLQGKQKQQSQYAAALLKQQWVTLTFAKT